VQATSRAEKHRLLDEVEAVNRRDRDALFNSWSGPWRRRVRPVVFVEKRVHEATGILALAS